MVALTGADLSGTSARIRAKLADGSWGPWYATAHEVKQQTPGPPAADAPAPGPDGTEPVFVGRTTAVQIAVTRPTRRPRRPRRKPANQPKSTTPRPTRQDHPPEPTKPRRQPSRRPRSRTRPRLCPGHRRATVRPERLRRADHPAESPGRRAVVTAERGAGARSAAQHHPAQSLGRGRLRPVRQAGGERPGARRGGASHRRFQRLRPRGLRGDHPGHLRLPHPHPGLVRHRLQRAGGQVRPGLRGPGRRSSPGASWAATPAASTAIPGACR